MARSGSESHALSAKTQTKVARLRKSVQSRFASRKSLDSRTRKAIASLAEGQADLVETLLEGQGILEQYAKSIEKQNAIKDRLLKRTSKKPHGRKGQS